MEASVGPPVCRTVACSRVLGHEHPGLGGVTTSKVSPLRAGVQRCINLFLDGRRLSFVPSSAAHCLSELFCGACLQSIYGPTAGATPRRTIANQTEDNINKGEGWLGGFRATMAEGIAIEDEEALG